MKFFLALCFLFPFNLFADVTSSCESVLTGTVNRADLSDVCYTQFGDDFLQWQGYWDGNANKYFTSVTGWQQGVNALAAETDWRLPTIKELNLLTTKGLVDVDNLAPDAFSKNWMVQQWFIRDLSDVQLIPVTDAYILSSSYQGDKGNGTTKVLALNIATGLIEALASNDFDSKSVYIVKVKQSAPVWVNITTQYADKQGYCLQHEDSLSTGIKVSICDATIQQKWFVETNTGFIRSYSGGCLQAKTFADYAETTYENCSNYLAVVSPTDSDRWDVVITDSDITFRNQGSQSGSNYYFYVTSGTGSSAKKGDVLVWDYTPASSDSQNTWYY